MSDDDDDIGISRPNLLLAAARLFVLLEDIDRRSKSSIQEPGVELGDARERALLLLRRAARRSERDGPALRADDIRLVLEVERALLSGLLSLRGDAGRELREALDVTGLISGALLEDPDAP